MKQWANDMERVAKSIAFEEKGYKITKELENHLIEAEVLFNKMSKLLDGNLTGKKATWICKKMVDFYNILQDLLNVTLIEINRPWFITHIQQMHPFLVFFNKMLKLVVKFDLFKIQNPTIFATYSEYRLLKPSEVNKEVEQIEDQKISTLQSICIPLGRLFLSFFSNSKFDLLNPCLISKITKISVDQEKLDNLGIFVQLSKLHHWKYCYIFLSAAINRLLDRTVFILDIKESEKLQRYYYLLIRQL